MDGLTGKEWLSIGIFVLSIFILKTIMSPVLAIVFALVISFVFLAIMDSKENSSSDRPKSPTSSGHTKVAPKPTMQNAPKPAAQNVPKQYSDPDYHFEGGNILRRYTGTSRSLKIPRGVIVVGDGDDVFSPNVLFFKTVFIPRSVKRIHLGAFAWCETVWYEGSEAEWRAIDIDPNHFATNYIPDYHKEDPKLKDLRIEHVSLHYNAPSVYWD